MSEHKILEDVFGCKKVEEISVAQDDNHCISLAERFVEIDKQNGMIQRLRNDWSSWGADVRYAHFEQIKVENRVKTVFLTSEELLGFFREPNEVLRVRINKPTLPADVVVIAINASFDPSGIRLLVGSMEFGPVPLGQCAPQFDDVGSLQFTYLTKQPDGSYRGVDDAQ